MSTSSIEVPQLLTVRGLPDEYAGKRWIENEEVALVSILDDATGNISTSDALVHFMCLMSKLIKLDHRVLCMEILLNHMDSKLDSEFVTFGGYRLLKRWIHDAEEDSLTSLLQQIIKFIRRLPFDSTAIKRSEIGKSLKKLQKYNVPSNELKSFQEDLQILIDEWKEKSIHEKKEQAKSAKSEEITTTSTATTGLDSTSKISVKEEGVAMEVDQPPSPSKPVPSAASNPINSNLISLRPLSELKPLIPIAANPSMAAAAAILTKSTAPVRERKSLDMLEGARKLLAQKAKATVSMDEVLPVSATASNPTPVDMKPLPKGGLKRSDDTKKEKKSIHWADEGGGLLREVHMFEVERIKASVASHKSHKDLVRRERQLEKETYLSRAEEAMQPSVKFVLPTIWTLPIGIVDNMGVAVSSNKDKQTRRIAHVLEVRYLDESLIPDDPDFDSSADIVNSTSESSAPSVVASWLLENEEDEDQHTFHVMAATPHLQAAPMMSAAGHLLQSMDFAMKSDEELNLFVGRLPLPIQMLDPITLQAVVQDPHILQSLLLPDGSVEEGRLSLLQSCASIEEYKMMVFGGGGGPMQQQQQPPQMGGFGQMPSYGQPMSMPMYGGNNGPMGGGGGGFDGMDPYAMNMNMNMNMPPVNMGHNSMHQLNWNQPFGMHDMNGWNNSNNVQSMSSSGRMGGSSGGSSTASASKRYQTTKSSTPCRFFSTPRGCSNGDKCPFGHFLDNSGGSNNAMMSSPGMSRAGPGSRTAARGPKRR